MDSPGVPAVPVQQVRYHSTLHEFMNYDAGMEMDRTIERLRHNTRLGLGVGFAFSSFVRIRIIT